jgi:hypothetical protein
MFYMNKNDSETTDQLKPYYNEWLNFLTGNKAITTNAWFT